MRYRGHLIECGVENLSMYQASERLTKRGELMGPADEHDEETWGGQ